MPTIEFGISFSVTFMPIDMKQENNILSQNVPPVLLEIHVRQRAARLWIQI